MTKKVPKLFTCRACKKDKPKEEMRKDARMKYGVDYECNECRRKRRQTNGEYIGDRIRRFAARKGGDVMFSSSDLNEMLQAKNCVYCGIEMTRGGEVTGATATADHVYPIEGRLGGYGGENIACNIVIACKSCNGAKKDMHIYDYYQRSEKFTPELWTKFVRDFTERLTGQPLTDVGVERMKQHLADEAAELARNAEKEKEKAV